MIKVKLPEISFNFSFKNEKEAKQEAIKVLFNCINDREILKDIIVIDTNKKPCNNCPVNKCRNCPRK